MESPQHLYAIDKEGAKNWIWKLMTVISYGVTEMISGKTDKQKIERKWK